MLDLEVWRSNSTGQASVDSGFSTLSCLVSRFHVRNFEISRISLGEFSKFHENTRGGAPLAAFNSYNCCWNVHPAVNFPRSSVVGPVICGRPISRFSPQVLSVGTEGQGATTAASPLGVFAKEDETWFPLQFYCFVIALLFFNYFINKKQHSIQKKESSKFVPRGARGSSFFFRETCFSIYRFIRWFIGSPVIYRFHRIWGFRVRTCDTTRSNSTLPLQTKKHLSTGIPCKCDTPPPQNNEQLGLGIWLK